MLRVRERASTPYPFVVFIFGFVVESIKELGGASPMTPSQSIRGEILKVICVPFDVVGDNEYLQFQILAKFKHICGKMEALKFQLHVGVRHPLGKSFITLLEILGFAIVFCN
jgi:hypothetical protein